MLIGHLLPGVKLLFFTLTAFLPTSLLLLVPVLCLSDWLSCLRGEISSSARAPTTTSILNGHAYTCTRACIETISSSRTYILISCMLTLAVAKMPKLSIWRQWQSGAGAVRQAVKPNQLRKHKIF